MRLLAGNVAGGRERFRPAAPRLAGTLRGGVATARLQRRYRGGTGAVHTGNGNAGEAARGAAARIFGQLPGKRRQTPEKGANRRNFQYIGSSRDRKDHPPLKNRGADVFNFRLWCPMGGCASFQPGGVARRSKQLQEPSGRCYSSFSAKFHGDLLQELLQRCYKVCLQKESRSQDFACDLLFSNGGRRGT